MSGALQVVAGTPAYVCAAEGPPIDGERAAADIIGTAFSAGTRRVVIPVSRLPRAFFDLKTCLAGEVLQKFVNYGFQVALVGDISAALAESKPLADFVRESNRGHQVWFVPDLQALEARLVGKP
jgi:hypothetical protein